MAWSKHALFRPLKSGLVSRHFKFVNGDKLTLLSLGVEKRIVSWARELKTLPKFAEIRKSKLRSVQLQYNQKLDTVGTEASHCFNSTPMEEVHKSEFSFLRE